MDGETEAPGGVEEPEVVEHPDGLLNETPLVEVSGDDLDEVDESIEHPAKVCLLYTSPSPRDKRQTRMPSSA